MNLKITGQNYEKELSFTGFAMSKLQNLFLVITTRKKRNRQYCTILPKRLKGRFIL